LSFRPEDGEAKAKWNNTMGNSQGRDNAKKRKARRKKMERLALAKAKQKPAK